MEFEWEFVGVIPVLLLSLSGFPLKAVLFQPTPTGGDGVPRAWPFWRLVGGWWAVGEGVARNDVDADTYELEDAMEEPLDSDSDFWRKKETRNEAMTSLHYPPSLLVHPISHQICHSLNEEQY